MVPHNWNSRTTSLILWKQLPVIFFYIGYVVYQFKAKASLWGLRIQDMHKVLMLTSKRKKNQKKIWDNLDAFFLEAVSQ